MNNDDKLIWTEKNSNLLLKTVVCDVTERTSVSSDGLEGKYIVMDAPDWAIVIPVIGEDFLMVRQWRHGAKALSTEFPGGVIEKGEDPAVAAGRELLEETGYKAGKITKLCSANPNPALFSNRFHIFLAEDLKLEREQELDDDEYVNFIRIPQKEVISQMGCNQNGDYIHGLMLAAIGAYLARM